MIEATRRQGVEAIAPQTASASDVPADSDEDEDEDDDGAMEAVDTLVGLSSEVFISLLRSLLRLWK